MDIRAIPFLLIFKRLCAREAIWYIITVDPMIRIIRKARIYDWKNSDVMRAVLKKTAGQPEKRSACNGRTRLE